jgi:hypothetical protein
MNAVQDDAIRAEHTFFERSRIDRSRSLKKRDSPELNEMFGVRIMVTMTGGMKKVSLFYWETRERRKECLPRILSRFINPTVTLIRK